MTVPLERALSKLGLATRTEARALIEGGRVRVDGRTIRDPLRAVVPEQVHLEIDGRAAARPEPLTIALHKPRGVVTTRRDPEGRQTVYDLLTGLDAHVVPVGRLDYATSGLLLLTNDTRFADWLTNPVNAVPRLYVVTARGRVTDPDVTHLQEGVRDRGEILRATSVQVRKSSARESHLIVELTEGKNREIRRLLKAIGHEVTRLRRISIGGLELGTMAPGTWRRVSSDELGRAFSRSPPPAAALRQKSRASAGRR